MDLKELLGDAYKEGMTFDEIAAALKNVTPPDPSAAEVDKLKAALSKANSQAAAFKKQLQGKQSEEEQKAAAQQEEHKKLVQENADLKRAITLSEKKAKLLGILSHFFVYLTFVDPVSGSRKTIKVYPGDRRGEPYWVDKNGNPTHYRNCKVNLIDTGE